MKKASKKPTREIDRDTLKKKRAEKARALSIRNKRKQKINERS